MTEPHQFFLEALVAEDGQFVRVGLPEAIRRNLIKTAENKTEMVNAKRKQLEQLLATTSQSDGGVQCPHN